MNTISDQYHRMASSSNMTFEVSQIKLLFSTNKAVNTEYGQRSQRASNWYDVFTHRIINNFIISFNSQTHDIPCTCQHAVEYDGPSPFRRCYKDSDKIRRKNFRGNHRLYLFLNINMFGLQNFIQHFQRYEARLFSHAGCTQAMMNMQRLIGVSLESTVGQTSLVVRKDASNRVLNSMDGTRLCGLLTAY